MSKHDNNDEFRPMYQKGRTSVDHRDIDAAGEDHPFGSKPQPFEADLRSLIREFADDLYESWEATVREYLANAETATMKVEDYVNSPEDSPFDSMIVPDNYEPKIEVTWDKKNDSLVIKDNGIGMAAAEVDEIFRQIGHSAARDDGTKSGQFGMGALSFIKLVGADNAMIMTSHSRLNDDNAAYYVTLAGVEPLRGNLADDEYGTKFQMTPKEDNLNIRRAVEKYSEWMRVPVIYREMDENGKECFNEDWGDKSLLESYSEDRICIGLKKERAYEAYTTPEANGDTLLLSMDIDRNDGKYRPSSHGSPYQFDVRILDESGKVIESSNGNEGLIPCSKADYRDMLAEARDPYIIESMTSSKDTIGQEVIAGPNEGDIAVADGVLDSGKPLPPENYVERSELHPDDEPGESKVIIGPNKGSVIVPKEEWDEMDMGRAEMYIPEDELEEYDIDTGEGDLCLPVPTSDRDRLQSHPTFWKYLGEQFAAEFHKKVEEVVRLLDEADNPMERYLELETGNLSSALRGIGKSSTGRRQIQEIVAGIEEDYGISVNESTAVVFSILLNKSFDDSMSESIIKAVNSVEDTDDVMEVVDKIGSDNSCRVVSREKFDDEGANISTTLQDIYLPEVITKAYPDGEIYMAKSVSSRQKVEIVFDLHEDNQVIEVDEYDEYEELFGWKKLKNIPHGSRNIREEFGDVLSDETLESVAPKKSSKKSSSSKKTNAGKNPEKRWLNIAKGSSYRRRFKMTAGKIRDQMEDQGYINQGSTYARKLVLFTSTSEYNMSDCWWIPGSIGPDSGGCAIANCTKGTYNYLKDIDGVISIEEYVDTSMEYTLPSTDGEITVSDNPDNLVIYVTSEKSKKVLSKDNTIKNLPTAISVHIEDMYHPPELPDNMMVAVASVEDMFWLRPLCMLGVDGNNFDPTVLCGDVYIRNWDGRRTIQNSSNIYIRARLSDWDMESPEMTSLLTIDKGLDLENGGHELVQTLGKLHDNGVKIYSDEGKKKEKCIT